MAEDNKTEAGKSASAAGIKEGLRGIAGWRPGPGLYAVCAVAALILLLWPLLRMAEYSVPWYDDYNYGRYAKTALEADPTLRGALKGAKDCITMSWYAWQGTYGSIFFMTLMPGVWGEEYYHLGPVFLILLLAVSVGVLVYVLLRDVLKADRVHAVGIAAATAAMAELLIYTSQQGFYWYNGGVHYVGMHSFALLMTAVCVKLLCADRVWKQCIWMVVGAGLGFVVAGGNYVTCLQGLLLVLSLIGAGCIGRRKQTLFLLPVLAVYVRGFYWNVGAPGNANRAASYVGWGMSPVRSVLYSFVEAAGHIWEFTGLMTIVLAALMLPMIAHMVKRTGFRFRLPGMVSLWSFCLYATGFTPSLYSLGHAGLDRALNAVKLTWQMLLILNLVYWCGWICQKKNLSGRMYRFWFYPAMAAAALAAFWAEPDRALRFSSYGAYHYVHTGEAYNFYQEYLERVEILKSDAVIAEFTPYHWRPWPICMGDLSENPQDESNRALEAYYGKDGVICVERKE